jgi:hypothetical protein
MKRRLLLCVTGIVSLAVFSVVARQTAADKPVAPAAKAQFEQLKKLAGDWSGKASHGDEEQFDAAINYRVTAAGSAVMETLFGGTEHEMVTMYHLHGDALVLTHYCALGNQPRMKSLPSDDPKKLVFKFLDGTNFDASKDMHMHEATIELVSDEHIRSVWTSFDKGKPLMTAKFDLKRKK